MDPRWYIPYGSLASEEAVERAVERSTDLLDACLIGGSLGQTDYDAAIRDLDRWAENQYRASARL